MQSDQVILNCMLNLGAHWQAKKAWEIEKANKKSSKLSKEKLSMDRRRDWKRALLIVKIKLSHTQVQNPSRIEINHETGARRTISVASSLSRNLFN